MSTSDYSVEALDALWDIVEDFIVPKPAIQTEPEYDPRDEWPEPVQY